MTICPLALFYPSQCTRLTDGRTDGQTDGRTDGILIARPRLHSMQRGNNARGQNCHKGVYYDNKNSLKICITPLRVVCSLHVPKVLNFTYMHSNVTIKNVSWPHFSWPTL